MSFYSSPVLASLKSVHETLSQERQKLQGVWETNNIHQSNTLAEVRYMSSPVIWILGHKFPMWFLMGDFLCSSLFLFLCRQPSAVSNSSHGPPSVADSAGEYFDASDDIMCGSSSEVSDESGLSEGSTTNSEPEEGHGGCMYMKYVF